LASVAVSTELIVADPREALLEAAEAASSLVVGSRGRGRLRSMTLGSVGVWVSQHAPCPVLISRPPRPGTEHVGLAVGVDGTHTSSAALAFAYAQASLRRVPLTVIHCVDEPRPGAYGVSGQADAELVDVPGHRRAVAESLAGFAETYPDVEVDVEVTRARPHVFLSHLAPPPVLLVIGTRQRSKMGAFFGGSVSRAVVEHARCTVAVVPVLESDHPGPGSTGSATSAAHVTG
ncbi:MAG: hypothetical protein QOK15_818, partial [Nocardioidaceae bacterium]|nr:hypothetical protein [Nocardioidaceae bacterium]